VGARGRRGASAAAEAVARFLESLVPEEALREADVRGTPRRVAEAFRDDLLDGYRCDPRSILRGAIPHDGHDLVAVTGIDFHAVCPHHLLPYRGTACIAYVPGGRVLGFGVLARLLDCFAHRLVIQEVLARQVADALVDGLGARGAACVLDAEQMCLTVRGERRREARTHSQAFAGEMDGDPAWERRVLRLAAGDVVPAARPSVRPARRPAARTTRGKGRPR
jgi:GTP cyclohydrolase IA